MKSVYFMNLNRSSAWFNYMGVKNPNPDQDFYPREFWLVEGGPPNVRLGFCQLWPYLVPDSIGLSGHFIKVTILLSSDGRDWLLEFNLFTKCYPHALMGHGSKFTSDIVGSTIGLSCRNIQWLPPAPHLV